MCSSRTCLKFFIGNVLLLLVFLLSGVRERQRTQPLTLSARRLATSREQLND